jgi:hypothetical protein
MSLTTPQAALSTVDLPPAKIKLLATKIMIIAIHKEKSFLLSFFALIF